MSGRETAAEHIRNALTLVAFGGCAEADAINARLRAALREVEAGNLKNPRKRPTAKARAFIARKIRTLAHEGRKAPARVAAAYRMARRAGFRSVHGRARCNPHAISETRNLRAAMTELEYCMDKTRGEVNRKINSVHQVLRMLYEQASQGVHENPTLAVLGNPPAKVVGTLSRRLYELRYQHAKDGKDYRHPFGPGASVLCLADGSVLIRAKHRLWEDL